MITYNANCFNVLPPSKAHNNYEVIIPILLEEKTKAT